MRATWSKWLAMVRMPAPLSATTARPQADGMPSLHEHELSRPAQPFRQHLAQASGARPNGGRGGQAYDNEEDGSIATNARHLFSWYELFDQCLRMNQIRLRLASLALLERPERAMPTDRLMTSASRAYHRR